MRLGDRAGCLAIEAVRWLAKCLRLDKRRRHSTLSSSTSTTEPLFWQKEIDHASEYTHRDGLGAFEVSEKALGCGMPQETQQASMLDNKRSKRGRGGGVPGSPTC